MFIDFRSSSIQVLKHLLKILASQSLGEPLGRAVSRQLRGSSWRPTSLAPHSTGRSSGSVSWSQAWALEWGTSLVKTRGLSWFFPPCQVQGGGWRPPRAGSCSHLGHAWHPSAGRSGCCVPGLPALLASAEGGSLKSLAE